VRAQAVTTVAVAALSLVAGGRPGVVSALFGAAVAWVTTLYASRRASVPEHTVGAALQRVMVGEFIKVLATIALFAAATRVPHLVWPALLCGYAAALVAFWLPSMLGSGRERGMDGAGDRVAARG
jgi:F0F1-type ATP synthase assembly protein I